MSAKKEIKKHAKKSAAEAREAAKAAKEEAQYQMAQIRNKLSEKLQTAKDRIIEAEQRTEDYIREHPVKSVLIAAGAGAVLGAVITAAIMKRRK